VSILASFAEMTLIRNNQSDSRFQALYSQVRLDQRIEVQETDIPKPLKIVIYRVIQEAFNNIAKHSRTNRILLRLKKESRGLLLEVKDYGQGFDLQAIIRSGSVPPGLGISSMRERVEGSGGTFTIRSVEKNGTSIQARWPLPAIANCVFYRKTIRSWRTPR
jgi:signal transduction histidine kinase